MVDALGLEPSENFRESSSLSIRSSLFFSVFLFPEKGKEREEKKGKRVCPFFVSCQSSVQEVLTDFFLV